MTTVPDNRPREILIGGIKRPIYYITDGQAETMGRKVAGIYALVCLKTGSLYVGSTSYVTRRIRQHFSDLQARIHGNYKMQNRFDQNPDKWAYVLMQPTAGLTRDEIYRIEYGYLKSPIYDLNIERSPWVKKPK